MDLKERTRFLTRFFFLSVLYLYFCVLIVLALPFVLTVKYTTQASMPPAGFGPVSPASDRPQTLALDRSATGIDGFVPLKFATKNSLS
jgi:hypothetical protein